MNIDDFLVSEKPHKRQVTMPDESQQTLYFLKPSAADIRRWLAAEMGNNEDKRLYAMQELIAACLYDIKQQRLAFSGPDHNKHQQLSWDACQRLMPPILALSGVPQQKKA